MGNLVVDGDGLLEGGELDGVDDGDEELGLDDGGIVVDGDESGVDKVSGSLDLGSSGEDLSSLGLDGLNAFGELLDGGLGVDGTAEGGGVEGVSDADLSVRLGEAGNGLVVDLLVDEDTTGRCAALTGSSDRAEESGRDGQLEIGIVHNDKGVVSSELQNGLSETTVNSGGNTLSDLGGSSEGDEGNTLILNHALSNDGSRTNNGSANGGVDSISAEDTLKDLGHGESAERSGGGSLPDVHVSANQRDGRVPGEDGHGEVEGGDDTDNSKGVVNLHKSVTSTLRVQDGASNGTADSGGEIANVNHLLDLSETLSQDLTHLNGDQLSYHVKEKKEC